MSVALDFGSYRMKSLRFDCGTLAARSCRTVYAVLDDDVYYRDLLTRLGTRFAICDGNITVIGDHAEELNWLGRIPCVPMLPEGLVPEDDPPARQMLSALVDCLLPDPEAEDELCGVVVPAGTETSLRESLKNDFVLRLLRLKGYKPLPVNAGMATLLAEAASSQFTGLGVSFGDSSCTFSLAWQGIEIAHDTVPFGGHVIDERLATRNSRYVWDKDGHCYLDTTEAGKWKHSFGGSIDEPRTMLEQVLRELYVEMLANLFERMDRSIRRCTQRTRIAEQPIPVICSGGPTVVAGFENVVRTQLAAAGLPLEFGEVRTADDPMFTVARGCLIQTQLELEMQKAAA